MTWGVLKNLTFRAFPEGRGLRGLDKGRGPWECSTLVPLWFPKGGSGNHQPKGYPGALRSFLTMPNATHHFSMASSVAPNNRL